MSKKEKDVELIPQPPSGWKVKYDGKDGNGPGTYPKVEFGTNSGPHLVVLKLQDPTATFNSADPIWVARGSTSPTQAGIDGQITDWAIFDGGKTLVLLDSNTWAGELSYRVKADGYDTPLDPIIKNGGTTPPPAPPPAYSAIEIAAAGLLLLVAFLAGMFAQRRFFATK